MATCPKCRNFFMGSDCPYCRADRQAPDYQKAEKERIEHEKRVEVFRAEWEDHFFCTTTPLLDGYTVDHYRGTVTGSAVLGTGFLSEFRAGFSDLFGSENASFAEKLDQVKDAAMKKAIKKALSLEANALIGIDIDFQIMNNNMVAAIVTGTAVFVNSTK